MVYSLWFMVYDCCSGVRVSNPPSLGVRVFNPQIAGARISNPLYIIKATLLVVLFTVHLTARGQIPASLNVGEAVTFDVYFKWGLLMPRAGEAVISFNKDNTVKDATYCYRLLFRTAKFFDSFFAMRDTLSSYYDTRNKLLYSCKRTNDGGYYSVDELRFSYFGQETRVHSRRYTATRVKLDTVLTSNNYLTDMLGAFYYMRSLERASLKIGDTFDITTAIGRDFVNIRFVYQQKSVIERGGVKYNTCYFKVEIHDEAFENAGLAAEVWVSDDDNYIPIKIRSKLKIGYAEIYYKSSSNLAHTI
jgi:hypothetical protein